MNDELNSMNDLSDEALGQPKLRRGQKVTGTVAIVDNESGILYVDLKTFTEGTMHLDHYTLDKSVTSFKGLVEVGDEITATVSSISKDEDRPQILLDRLPILRDKKFNLVKECFDNGDNVTVKVVKQVNKGWQVALDDVTLFMPQSQSPADCEVGQEFEVVILDVDDKRRSGVVSRRRIEHAEFVVKKQEELDTIKEGDILNGVVSRIEKYGVFVKFNYNYGLIRLGQLDHKFVKDPNDFVKEGDSLEVKVLSNFKGRIDLSRKALLATPYEMFNETHKVADEVTGEVVKKLPNIGLICKLADGITGLLHVSEFSWNPNDNLMNEVKIGDELPLAILNIDPKKEKIGLSRKALIDNPWAKVNLRQGDPVEAVIVEITPEGLKCTCSGVDATIDKRDILIKEGASNKLEDHYAVGDTVKATVSEVNTRRWILTLNMKDYQQQVERKQFEQYMDSEKEEDVKTTLGDLFKDTLK